MGDVFLARAPVAAGKAERLREWDAELQRREDEVVETLQHEGVYTETAFRREGDPSYLSVYMEAEDLQAGDDAGSEERYEVDAEHHEVLAECLAGECEPRETIGQDTFQALR